ncbi:MAG: 5'-3' exonuclease H3TH domain-containing protein, partial [Rubrivivax sp.]
MPERPTLLLVDGSSYLYRAYHAMPDLRSPDGFPTGAIHGLVAMLRRLREDIPAEHAACVFDAKGDTFRNAWYADYKAHRPPMPEDLARQIEPIHELVRLLGWPVLEVPGVEADDVIGTLARLAEASGHQVVVSTGDKDLAQLVTPHVRLINTMSGETLGEAAVQAKFGVPPRLIVDYLTLVGDAVDNVPGVNKVGPKTAARWLAEHGSLEGVMAAAAGMSGATGENLRQALDWLPMGRRLVTVKTDCDLCGHVPQWPQLEALALQPLQPEGLLAFYARHGFRSWRRELEARGVALPAGASVGSGAGDADPTGDSADPASTGATAGPPLDDAPGTPPPGPPLAREYETVATLERLQAWLERLRAAPLVAFDTETDSLDPLRARLVGLSFAVEPGRAAYVPLAHVGPDAPEQLPLQQVLDTLRPWLEDAAASKLAQHAKYDLHVLANHGITVRGLAHDTLLESYVLEAHKPHSLESLAERHLGRRGIAYEELCGKGANQIPFAQVEVARAAEYSGEDSEMTLQVHQLLWPRIQAEPGLRRIYADIELPVSAVLARIERHGVLIDP